MDVTLGTLQLSPVKEHLDLLAEPVAQTIVSFPNIEGVGVVEIDPNLSDTAAFCEFYKTAPEQAANCVVLRAKMGEGKELLAAAVILASTKIDVNNVARATLGAKKVSFAQMEQAVAESNMEYGAITPVGIPPSWSLLIDKAVADSGYVIIGSGIRKSKLAVSGRFLASLPNGQVIEGLGIARR